MDKPTREEYSKMVKDEFLSIMKNWDESEVLDYFNSEEAQNIIDDSYKVDSNRFANNQITAEQFRKAGPNAVANCLMMCFE